MEWAGSKQNLDQQILQHLLCHSQGFFSQQPHSCGSAIQTAFSALKLISSCAFCLKNSSWRDPFPLKALLTLEPTWKDLISELPCYSMCTSFPKNVPNSHRSHIVLQTAMLLVAQRLIRKDKIRRKTFFSLWVCAFFLVVVVGVPGRVFKQGQFSLYGCFFPLINQPSALLPVYHGGDLISIKLLTTAVIISASQFMRL